MDIVDSIYSYLPAKKKQTPSGWTKFNAVCCPYNGTTPDTRQRAGIIRNGDGCSYHCFNCGFKASYQFGRHLPRKMRQLLQWFGAPDDVISKLALEALKIEGDQQTLEQVTIPHLPDRELPEGFQTFTDWQTLLLEKQDTDVDPGLGAALDYIYSRNLDPFEYPFGWADSLPDRVIIPFIYEHRFVGWTARKLTEGRPKYLSDQTPGFVFNLDAQANDRKYVIVVEGPMDAVSVEGVALLGADIMDKQSMFINRLGRDVILVPDRDPDGLRTVEQAVKLGWSVSMPDWEPDIKDSNDAVRKYGKLWTLWSIINSAESSEVKIKLRTKQWYSEKF
jgi:hypothetical protein